MSSPAFTTRVGAMSAATAELSSMLELIGLGGMDPEITWPPFVIDAIVGCARFASMISRDLDQLESQKLDAEKSGGAA